MSMLDPVLTGLREGGLSLAYNLYVGLRGIGRQLTRPTQVGVRVIAPRDERVLLVRHRGGRLPWSLPGGGVANGESAAVAALRELREESGCSGRVRQLHGLFHNFNEGMNNYIVIFVCDPEGEARPLHADLEIVEAHFFPFNDLPPTLDPGSRRRIEEYRRGATGLYGAW